MNEVYAKIRQIRKSKNITLKELSENTGLSLSFLSQVERGISDITLMSLGRVANVLGIDMKELFDDSLESKYYCTKEEHKKIETGHSFLEYFKLSGDFSEKKIDAILVTCLPHSAKTEYEPHGGEEFIYVLEGEATVEVNGVVYKVGEGETIHYPSTQNHTLKNDSDVKLKALIVVTQLLF